LNDDELHDIEEKIPTLTFDVHEAEVFVGRIRSRARALFELRRLNLMTEDAAVAESTAPPRKRVRAQEGAADFSSDSEEERDEQVEGSVSKASSQPGPSNAAAPRTVKIVKLAWFTDSITQGITLPFDDYMLYEGKVVSAPTSPTVSPAQKQRDPSEILRRAQLDAVDNPTPQFSRSQRRGQAVYRAVHSKPPSLIQQTTSEHDEANRLPPVPTYLHTTYSCQRPTPIHPPNEPFIDELTKIRTTRSLIGDKIGVRAYSTAIASLAAYPYSLTNASGTVNTAQIGEENIHMLYRSS
jgi:DNA polymerase IV